MTDVPRFHEFFVPALRVLADGQERHPRAVIAEVADAMALDAEQLGQTIPSGQRRVDNRILWALSYLGQAKAVERPRRGVYRITDRGQELLRDHPARLTVTDLRRYPEFVEFQERSSRAKSEIGQPVPINESETPLEQIEAAITSMDTAVAADLVQRVRDQPPEFLEKAVLRLLVAMGYGGATGDAQHLGGSGDGGFDGVINQDALGLERVYVQAKRYAADNIVGRPAVQGFVGALHGMGAAGGVFITTSRFSADAVAFAAGIKPRVILIDGDRLGQLMVAHRVGVQERQVIHVVEVDEDFFE